MEFTITITSDEIREHAEAYGFSPTDDQCGAIVTWMQDDIFDGFCRYAYANMLGDKSEKTHTYAIELSDTVTKEIAIRARDIEDAEYKAHRLVSSGRFFFDHMHNKCEHDVSPYVRSVDPISPECPLASEAMDDEELARYL